MIYSKVYVELCSALSICVYACQLIEFFNLESSIHMFVRCIDVKRAPQNRDKNYVYFCRSINFLLLVSQEMLRCRPPSPHESLAYRKELPTLAMLGPLLQYG